MEPCCLSKGSSTRVSAICSLAAMPPERVADPSLPQPWEALYDPASGLRYYWNPQTNVTTYDRPAGQPAAPAVPPVSLTSSRCVSMVWAGKRATGSPALTLVGLCWRSLFLILGPLAKQPFYCSLFHIFSMRLVWKFAGGLGLSF